MAMQTDVKNIHANASSQLLPTNVRTRVKGMILTSTGGAAGLVQLRSGGASGTILIEVDLPATAAFHNAFIPGEGVLFTNGVYATLTNCYISMFYG